MAFFLNKSGWCFCSIFWIILLNGGNVLFGQVGINTEPKVIVDTTQVFESFTIEQGLPANRTLDIYQDKYGFIWMATTAGLSRWDGFTFVNFFHNPLDSLSLSDDYVTRLTEDSNGNLWVGTRNGLNRLNRRDHTFTRYFSDPLQPEDLPGNHIRAFLPDTAGVLWLETANGFLSRFDTQEERFDNYGHTAGVSFYDCHSIKELNNGDLMLVGRDQKPAIFDRKKKILKRIVVEGLNSSLGLTQLDADVFQDEKGNYWCGASAGRFYIVDSSFQNITPYSRISSVYDIHETDDGNLWLGGYAMGAIFVDRKAETITVYEPSNENSQSIIHRQVNKIFEDSYGNIWFATSGGVSKMSPLRSNFIQHIKNENGSNKITEIIPDHSDSILWIGTNDEGLFKYNLNKKKFVQNWRYPELVANQVSALQLDKDGLLWIGFWAGRGFNKFDTNTGEISKYQYCTNTGSDWYSDIIETKKGDVYFGMWGGAGIFRFDKENDKIDAQAVVTSMYPKSRITFFEHFKDHLAFYYKGGHARFKLYNTKTKTFRHISTQPKKGGACIQMSYPQRQIYQQDWTSQNLIYELEAIEGQIWIAANDGVFKMDTVSYQGMLSTLSPPNDTIIAFQIMEETKQLRMVSNDVLYIGELSSEQISSSTSLPFPISQPKSSILLTDAEQVYIFDEDHLQQYHLEKGEWKTSKAENEKWVDITLSENSIWLAERQQIFQIDKEKNSDRASLLNLEHPYFSLINNISSIAAASEKSLWVGTNNGLFKILIDKNEIIPFFHDPMEENSLPHNKVYQIRLDEAGNLWVATEKGMAKLITKDNTFELHNQAAKDGISYYLTISLMEDSKGNIWAGSSRNGNLNIYNPQTKTFKYFEPQPWNPRSVKPDPLIKGILSLYEDSQKRVWVGGANLSLFNEATQDFSHYHPGGNNPFNQVVSIQEDDNGLLWLGTNKGLYLFNPEDESFFLYGMDYNIQGLDFSSAACKMSNGNLVLGGSNGFNIIDTKNSQASNFNPNLVAYNFRAGQDFFVENPDSELKTLLNSTQNTIELEVAILEKSRETFFKYRLKNYEKEWKTQSSRDRLIKYDNLPPGSYTLELAAGNNFGKWTDTLKTITFSTEPAFWNSWLGRSLMALGGIALVILLFNWQQRRLLKEKDNALHLKFLQVKSLQSQMNPHFVFNVLGSMQNLILNSSPREANDNLVRLSTLIRRFLDSTVSIEMPQHSFSSEIALEQEVELLQLYMEFEQLQYKNTFDFELVLDEELNPANYTLPPMIIQPYVENAIKHGLLHKKTGYGQLSVRFILLEDDALQCVIEDNGVGRAKAREIQERSYKKYKSYGTTLVQRRIDILNELGYDIDIHTFDRPLGGTTVNIKIDRKYD